MKNPDVGKRESVLGKEKRGYTLRSKHFQQATFFFLFSSKGPIALRNAVTNAERVRAEYTHVFPSLAHSPVFPRRLFWDFMAWGCALCICFFFRSALSRFPMLGFFTKNSVCSEISWHEGVRYRCSNRMGGGGSFASKGWVHSLQRGFVRYYRISKGGSIEPPEPHSSAPDQYCFGKHLFVKQKTLYTLKG